MKTKNKKKKQAKKAVAKTIKNELTIRVQPISPVLLTAKDLEPIRESSKYMIPKTWMSEKQVLRMVQKTPQQHIYTRPAKGGGTWNYVTGNYIEKMLNYIFGWNWDFEVVNHGKEGDMVWVLGKLTVKDDHGHTITKSQFGRSDVKIKKGGGMLDFGNDLKSATTDALKKCSSLLGIASDVYGKLEIKAETGNEVPETSTMSSMVVKSSTAPHSPSQPMKEGQVVFDGKPTWVCCKDQDPISDAEYTFSMRMFGKPLCREHQLEAKKK